MRRQLPIGALPCVIHGPTAGRRWEASAARKQLDMRPPRRGEAAVRATPIRRRARYADVIEKRPLSRMSDRAIGRVGSQRQDGR